MCFFFIFFFHHVTVFSKKMQFRNVVFSVMENLLTDIWSLKLYVFLMHFSTILLSTKQGGNKRQT